jgi:hypothetical protein
LIIFFMVAYFVVLFQVVFDLFRDHELSGWAKAGWLVFIIVLPFLGLLVYLIVRGTSMRDRAIREQAQAKQDFDAYVRDTAGSGGPAAEIANAKKLLDEGTISPEEFEAIKRKALG